MFKDTPIVVLYFLKYHGDEYGLRGSIFSHFFESSRNHPKSIAICPGIKISHFGIITPPQKKTIIILESQEKQQQQKTPKCVAGF